MSDHPGEGRDPCFGRSVGAAMDPGLRRDGNLWAEAGLIVGDADAATGALAAAGVLPKMPPHSARH
jgi:hypothetical protein